MIKEVVFLTDFLVSYCFLVKILNKEVRRYWLLAVSSVIIAGLIVANIITEMTPVIVLNVISSTLLVFMIKGKLHENIVNVVFAYIVCDSVAESAVIVANIILKKIVAVERLEFISIVISICNIGVSLLIFLVAKIYNHNRRSNKKVSVAAIFVISAFVIWVMGLVVTFINFMQGFVDDKTVLLISDIILCAGTISIIFIAILIFYIYHMNRELEKSYETEIELKEKQKDYYEDLLHREDETRRFRHETASHIGVIEKMLSDSKYDEALNYVSKLNLQLKNIQSMVFCTGNEIFDMMLGNYVPKLNSNVKVKVFGTFSGNLKADNYIQCTIFSNVIKNAVEELNRHEEDDLKLYIHINPTASGVSIIVENSSAEKVIIANNIKTSKSDKRNHGYGIKNLQEGVKLAGGELKLSYSDGMFTSEITLPYDIGN